MIYHLNNTKINSTQITNPISMCFILNIYRCAENKESFKIHLCVFNKFIRTYNWIMIMVMLRVFHSFRKIQIWGKLYFKMLDCIWLPRIATLYRLAISSFWKRCLTDMCVIILRAVARKTFWRMGGRSWASWIFRFFPRGEIKKHYIQEVYGSNFRGE